MFGDEMIRSGSPICHSFGPAKWTGGGMSAGLPRGAPLSAHHASLRDLLRGQRQVALEPLDADVLLDVPGRHDVLVAPQPGPILHGARPRTRVLVGDQRHRRHRVGAVAALAAPLQDRRDVLGERDVLNVRRGLCVRGRGRRQQGRDHRREQRRPETDAASSSCRNPPRSVTDSRSYLYTPAARKGQALYLAARAARYDDRYGR